MTDIITSFRPMRFAFILNRHLAGLCPAICRPIMLIGLYVYITKHICIIIDIFTNNNVHGRKLESWIKYTNYLNYQFR